MKLAVIGGGGVRAPFLAKSLIKNAHQIGIDEIVFMDSNPEKLNIFGTLSKIVAEKINPNIKFTLTLDTVEAVKDANFVITTIRSGGDESRVYDERVALDLGVLGQETTGAGGFAMSLRSVPILIDLCNEVKEHSKKDVLLFNFTNPSGIVTRALRNEGFDFVYGICDAPSGFENQLVKLLDTDKKDFEMTCFGLNHLSWFRDFYVKGEDVYDKLMSDERIYQNSELRYFNEEVIKMVGNRDLPNEYLYFYYFRNKAIDSIKNTNKTRGEIILEINNRMIDVLKKIDIENQPQDAFKVFIEHYYEREDQYFAIESGKARKPTKSIPSLEEFSQQDDTGGYAGVVLRFIKAFLGEEAVKMVLIVPNNDSLKFLSDNDVIEISCKIEKNKITPVVIDEVDPLQKNLISTVNYFENQTVKAIKYRDKKMAIKALMFHPQINSYEIASKLLDAYLEEYKKYVGEWK